MIMWEVVSTLFALLVAVILFEIILALILFFFMALMLIFGILTGKGNAVTKAAKMWFDENG